MQLTQPFEAIEGTYRLLAESFCRSLRAQNRSPRTITLYSITIAALYAYLRERGMPTEPHAITREHLEEYINYLFTDTSPTLRPGRRRKGAARSETTVAQYYSCLHAYFAWLVREEEITRSPMERMQKPRTDAPRVAVLTPDQLRALLRACEGREWIDRRDAALVRLLIDTGMRRSEVAALELGDIDFTAQTATVRRGKGGKSRTVAFGLKTAEALDRYIRARRHCRYAPSPALWLTVRGPMKPEAVYHAVGKRASRAGIGHVYTHLFRHTFASMWLEDDGQEGDLMELAGWSSRTMLGRYGASMRAIRARTAHRKHGPGDRI